MATPTMVYSRSEGDKFNTDANLIAVSCATCHMIYGIPQSLYKAARMYPGENSYGWKLCCPLGHSWWYVGESFDDKLRRAKDEAAGLRASLDQTQASLRAQRGAATRARNQRDHLKEAAAIGACPCCGKEYKYLRRHMDRIHPDYKDEDPDQ